MLLSPGSSILTDTLLLTHKSLDCHLSDTDEVYIDTLRNGKVIEYKEVALQMFFIELSNCQVKADSNVNSACLKDSPCITVYSSKTALQNERGIRPTHSKLSYSKPVQLCILTIIHAEETRCSIYPSYVTSDQTIQRH